MKQLENWFPKRNWKDFRTWNQETNHKDPLGIGVYEVDSDFVKLGTRQVCFRLDRADRISFEPFSMVPNIIGRIINAMAG
jgi:hypothetical protein